MTKLPTAAPANQYVASGTGRAGAVAGFVSDCFVAVEVAWETGAASGVAAQHGRTQDKTSTMIDPKRPQ